MNNVSLLYVGAVLLVNGMMLLDRVPPKAAAGMNLFVGGLGTLTPIVLIIQAGADTEKILGASGIFLFGFTYLYVGINNLAGFSGEGLGWFCLFVTVAAVFYAGLSFWRSADPLFGVVWLSWAYLWFLFFLVLALGMEHLTRFTGWSVVLLSLPTTTVPAFLVMTGAYESTAATAWTGTGIVLVLVAIAAVLGFRTAPARPGRTVPSMARSA